MRDSHKVHLKREGEKKKRERKLTRERERERERGMNIHSYTRYAEKRDRKIKLHK